MANRRMFSADVVCTDRFVEMPSSTQALYFQLGMKADDDGFISSPKQITRMVGAAEDDLKLLAANGFIIPFESGVVVISDWKINNLIRKDRYTPTRCLDEMKQLSVFDDKYLLSLDYQPVGNQVATKCQPVGNQPGDTLATQVRLGKDSINNICSPEPDERESNFEKIYAIYPKKRGRTKAFANYCSWLKGRSVNGKRRKLTNREMYLAVYTYVEQQREHGTELEYYKNFDTLMGSQLLDYVEVEQSE